MSARTAVFFLVDDGASMPRWCQMDETATNWIDAKGRRIPREDGRPLAHVEGESIEATLSLEGPVADLERNAAARFLLDPWSNQGWISPTGRFYGCAFYAHDDIAHAYLRKSVPALERAGFVRVHADSYRTDPFARREITSRQRDVLEALGFPGEGSFERRAAYEPDRNAPPPPFAVKPPSGMETRKATGTEPPRLDAAAARPLLDRISLHPAFESFVASRPELVVDLGGGNWKWLLHGDVDVGSEDHPATLLAAPGVHAFVPGFGQVELVPWHEEGVHVSPEVEATLTGTSVPAP